MNAKYINRNTALEAQKESKKWGHLFFATRATHTSPSNLVAIIIVYASEKERKREKERERKINAYFCY